MKKGYIYKITNPNGKIYVGQSINLKSRKNHYKALHCKRQPKIYNSLKKYGWENHIFEIIEEVECVENDLSLLNEREQFWIAKLDSWKNGMNCNEGGLNRRLSEETKKKLSQVKKGKKVSEEARLHMSEAQKGRKHSEETKKKMGESQMGEKNHRYGKKTPHSEETKRKIGEGRKGKLHTDESKKLISQNRIPVKRKVMVDGIIYDSIKEAAEVIGLTKGGLTWRLNSKNFTNYIWIEKSVKERFC